MTAMLAFIMVDYHTGKHVWFNVFLLVSQYLNRFFFFGFSPYTLNRVMLTLGLVNTSLWVWMKSDHLCVTQAGELLKRLLTYESDTHQPSESERLSSCSLSSLLDDSMEIKHTRPSKSHSPVAGTRGLCVCWSSLFSLSCICNYFPSPLGLALYLIPVV